MRRYIPLLSLLLSLTHINTYSQQIVATLSHDTLNVNPGDTFTNWLVVRNTGRNVRTAHVQAQIPGSVQLLSVVSQKVMLLAGETKMIPLKGLLTQHPKKHKEIITVQLSDSSEHETQVLKTVLSVIEKNQTPLVLYNPEQYVILHGSNEPGQIQLRMVHRRLQSQAYSIEVQSLPANLKERSEPLRIRLEAQQDTVVLLSVIPRRSWSASIHYQLMATVRDTTESIVGTVLYRLMVISPDKRFARTLSASSQAYGANIGINKLSNNQLAREVRVWGADSLGNGHLSFQAHYIDFSGSTYRQMQNSFLSYQTPNALIRVGSLFDYHEMPLIGRGIKVQLSQANSQLAMWGVNTNPNWFDRHAGNWSSSVASIRYMRQLAGHINGTWALSSSYYGQPGNGRVGYLNYVTLRFDRSGGHSFEFLAGQSNEYARQGSNHARTPGWAGLIHYSLQRPTLRLEWRSYCSSPAYAGLQRGATLLHSQFTWQPSERTALLIRLNHVSYNQQRFRTASDSYQLRFGNSIAEARLLYQIKATTVTIRSYRQWQTDITNPFSQRSDAWRTATGIDYRSKDGQQLSIHYDLGLIYNRAGPITDSKTGFLSQRATSSIGLGRFCLWGYWQRGPYFLYDFRVNDPKSIVSTSLTPMITIGAPGQKLSGSAGLMYLDDGVNKRKQYIAVGRLQYRISPSCSIRLEGNGTPYSEKNQYAYSQYRFEMTKLFSQGNQKMGELRLSFFRDQNGNEQHDPGEKWVDSLLVTVNDQTFFTNSRGTIAYTHLPPGTYHVSAVSIRTGQHSADPILYQESLDVGHKIHRVVALQQTFRVSGNVRCQNNAYDRKPCDFDRFVVEIQRDDKEVSVTGLLPDGSFTVHLVPGAYTIQLRDKGKPFQPVVQTAAFTLESTGRYPAFDWVIDGSTRSVEIQRFKDS